MGLMGRTLLGLGMAALLLTSPGASAQTPENQGQSPWSTQQRHHGQGQRGDFFKSLGLSEQQKEQLKGLRDVPREERDARLKQILTPEQYAKVQDMRSKHGDREGRPKRGDDLGLSQQQKEQLKGLRGLSPEERQAKLQQILTPEQLARVQAHQEEFKSKMAERQQRFAQELGLTQEQQDQMRSAFQDMRQSGQGKSREEQRSMMREKMQSILTPEQFQKLEQMRKEHHREGGGPGRRG